MKVRARLIKHRSENGFFEINSDVPLGKEYIVVVESRKVWKLWNLPTSTLFEAEVIWTMDGTWLPTEVLDISTEEVS